jgi:hypothetical protein
MSRADDGAEPMSREIPHALMHSASTRESTERSSPQYMGGTRNALDFRICAPTMRAHFAAEPDAAGELDMSRTLTNGNFETQRQPAPIALCDAGMRAPRAEEAF